MAKSSREHTDSVSGTWKWREIWESEIDKEREKSRERTELSREEAGQAKTKEQARRKTDVHTEMKKMLSTAPRNIAMKI